MSEGINFEAERYFSSDFSEKLLRTCLQTVSKFYVDEIGTYFGGLSNLTKMLSSTSTATRKL